MQKHEMVIAAAESVRAVVEAHEHRMDPAVQSALAPEDPALFTALEANEAEPVGVTLAWQTADRYHTATEYSDSGDTGAVLDMTALATTTPELLRALYFTPQNSLAYVQVGDEIHDMAATVKSGEVEAFRLNPDTEFTVRFGESLPLPEASAPVATVVIDNQQEHPELPPEAVEVPDIFHQALVTLQQAWHGAALTRQPQQPEPYRVPEAAPALPPKPPVTLSDGSQARVQVTKTADRSIIELTQVIPQHSAADPKKVAAVRTHMARHIVRRGEQAMTTTEITPSHEEEKPLRPRRTFMRQTLGRLSLRRPTEHLNVHLQEHPRLVKTAGWVALASTSLGALGAGTHFGL